MTGPPSGRRRTYATAATVGVAALLLTAGVVFLTMGGTAALVGAVLLAWAVAAILVGPNVFDAGPRRRR